MTLVEHRAAFILASVFQDGKGRRNDGPERAEV